MKKGYTIDTEKEKEILTMAITKITSQNFESEVLNESKTVLVDFWADWCGPCKMLSPLVDEVAQEITDIKVGKVNVDEQPELAMKYNVMSIPTLIVFQNGDAVEKSVGFVSKDEILSLLKK